jgi:CRP/FNR family cyclic AMP-dependent transcriptional regulator
MTAPSVPRLLAPLAPAERDRVVEAAMTGRYARGENVVQEGERGESLHLVRSGRLAVRVSTPDGATATLSVLSTGDSFGELALLGADHIRTATVVALERSETLVLTRAAFDALCREHPAVGLVLTQALARRVQQLSASLLEALYVPVERRLVARLVDLAVIYGEGRPRPPVIVPITQDDLAGMAGTTRPTTNQVLQRLADEGVLALGRGRIELIDVESLRAKAAVWGYY